MNAATRIALRTFFTLLAIQISLMCVGPVAWFVATSRIATNLGYVTRSEQAVYVDDHYEVEMDLLPGHRNYIANGGILSEVYVFAYSCERGIMLDDYVGYSYSNVEAFGRCDGTQAMNTASENLEVNDKTTFVLVSYATNDYQIRLSNYLPILQEPTKTYFESQYPFEVVQKRKPLGIFEIELFVMWSALWVLGFLLITYILWKNYVENLIQMATIHEK